MMKNLIVNADDFGRHEEINDAVILGFEKGCITSASIMPNCSAFEDAVLKAGQCTGLGIGVHFTLVGEKPLLPVEEVPSLIQENGFFYQDHIAFIKQYICGRVRRDEIHKELAAQMDKVKRSGLPISHVDGHQHMHILPGILDIVLDLAQENSVPAVRIPSIPIGFTGGYGFRLGQLIGQLGLHVLAEFARYKARKRNFKMPDFFSGIVAGESVNETCFLQIINELQNGTTEVMMHPGKDDALLQKVCNWQHSFEAELRAVMSEKVNCVLREKQVRLVNFNDLRR